MNDTVTKISVGAIINETLAISRRHLKTFGVVAVVLTALPQIVVGLLEMGGPTGQTSAAAALATIPVAIAAIFAQAGILYGALEDQRGRTLSTAEVFAACGKYFVRVFVVSLIMGFGVGFASILLLVPGLILATMWSVAQVVAVARDKGFSFALSESSAMTKGNRWRILGLLAIYFVVLMVIYIGAGALTVAIGPMFLVAVQAIVAPIQTVIGCCGVVALYSALDRNRGGLNAASLAQTFD